MPTSSQCLIYEKTLFGRPVSGRSSSMCWFREKADCSIASLYSLDGYVPACGASVQDSAALALLGRETAQLINHLNLPKVTRNLLHKLSEKPLGDPEYIISSIKTPRLNQRNIQGSSGESALMPTPGNARPRTAFPVTCSKIWVDPLMVEPLVSIGFRRSDLVPKDDCLMNFISQRKAKSQTSASRCESKTSYEEPREEIKLQTQSELDIRRVPSAGMMEQSPGEIKTAPCPSEEKILHNPDSNSGDSFELAKEEFNRIKPSTHMRRDVPASRPLAAIFSFRDNEFSSHSEVKFLIETQIGVKVKILQFDPLDIRVCKPGVHSRWIVEFYSEQDLEKALSQGMTIGKDKLIFYRHDDIARREVSSFKYFMTIVEAKKKLKTSKSLHYKPGPDKLLQLRNAYSQKVV